MLPFLQPKKQAGVIIAKMKGDKVESEMEEGDLPPALMAAAEDLLSAIASKDAKGVAAALHAAFEVADSLPHKEGPHEGDDAE